MAKFKVCFFMYLLTRCVSDFEKTDKLKQSLPSGVMDVNKEPLTMMVNMKQGFKSYVNHDVADRQNIELTEEEYNHVRNLRHGNTSCAGAGDNNDCKENLAGNMSLLSDAYDHHWIIDLGATHHIKSCKQMLAEFSSLSDKKSNTVQHPTGNRDHIMNTRNTIIMGCYKTFSANKHVLMPHDDTRDIIHDADTGDIMHDALNESTDPLTAEEDKIPNEASTDETSSEATHAIVTTVPLPTRPNRAIHTFISMEEQASMDSIAQ
ncbi:hypothetical protein H5410_032633 [Solanum commersonii]|uniref:Uncharacterized protein n=1 Tax=Solanum commersonii TaxID=4109 RepID=A0A9J5YNG2_SOLCO|nr:hypothetical protein H5410_032633 [Solanum commersonii]